MKKRKLSKYGLFRYGCCSLECLRPQSYRLVVQGSRSMKERWSRYIDKLYKWTVNNLLCHSIEVKNLLSKRRLPLWVILVDLITIVNKFLTMVRVLLFNISTDNIRRKASAIEEKVCPLLGACDKVWGGICPKLIVMWKVFKDNNAVIILNIFY